MVGEDYEIAAVEELSEEGSRVIAEIRAEKSQCSTSAASTTPC